MLRRTIAAAIWTLFAFATLLSFLSNPARQWYDYASAVPLFIVLVVLICGYDRLLIQELEGWLARLSGSNGAVKSHMTNIDHFKLLNSEIARFDAISGMSGPIGLLGQEALRFRSIAGTLKANGMLDNSSVDQRYITHILARSLIESFFWLTYIFDDPAKRQDRYKELVDSFKSEYLKLHNEQLPINAQLPQPDAAWQQIPRAPDVRSMLSRLQNAYGNKLDYLYPVYRIASFDTHGKSLNNIVTSAFGGASPNFPVLDLEFGFDLIANQYLHTLQELVNAGEV